MKIITESQAKILEAAARCIGSENISDCSGCPFENEPVGCTDKLSNLSLNILRKSEDLDPKRYQAAGEPFTKDLPVMLEEGATLPTRGHATDAGLDLYAVEGKTVPLYGFADFDTGVHVEIPPGHCGILMSKSGLNIKRNLISTGLIDEGYSGSIRVKLYNLGDRDQRISAGQKVSQLVIVPCAILNPILVEEVHGGERGSNGFGSTGE